MPSDTPFRAARDGIVDRLVADLRPQRARSARRDAGLLALVGMAELALLWASGLARPDLGHAMGLMSFWWRVAGLGAIAGIGSATCAASFDPARRPRRGLRLMPVALVAIALSGWMIDSTHGASSSMVARLAWTDGIMCASKIVALSIPPMLALFLLMRDGAPSEPGGTALAAGAAGSAWGALVFVLACPYDDPLYIAVWYAVGCGIVTGVARLVLPRLTRW